MQSLMDAVTNVKIIPDVWTQGASPRCSCPDFAPDKWCKHVAALGYELINRCEVDSFYPLKLRGIDIAGMLRKRVRSQVICLSDDDEDEAEGNSPNNPITL